MTVRLTPMTQNSKVQFQPAELSWSPGQRAEAMLYITGLTPGVDNISFVFWGDGEPLLVNGLPHQETKVLQLILITFSPQPPILPPSRPN